MVMLVRILRFSEEIFPIIEKSAGKNRPQAIGCQCISLLQGNVGKWEVGGESERLKKASPREEVDFGKN